VILLHVLLFFYTIGKRELFASFSGINVEF